MAWFVVTEPAVVICPVVVGFGFVVVVVAGPVVVRCVLSVLLSLVQLWLL